MNQINCKHENKGKCVINGETYSLCNRCYLEAQTELFVSLNNKNYIGTKSGFKKALGDFWWGLKN